MFTKVDVIFEWFPRSAIEVEEVASSSASEAGSGSENEESDNEGTEDDSGAEESGSEDQSGMHVRLIYLWHKK